MGPIPKPTEQGVADRLERRWADPCTLVTTPREQKKPRVSFPMPVAVLACRFDSKPKWTQPWTCATGRPCLASGLAYYGLASSPLLSDFLSILPWTVKVPQGSLFTPFVTGHSPGNLNNHPVLTIAHILIISNSVSTDLPELQAHVPQLSRHLTNPSNPHVQNWIILSFHSPVLLLPSLFLSARPSLTQLNKPGN